MHDAEYVKRTGKNDKSTIEVEVCLLHMIKVKENCCHRNEIMGRISTSGGDWGIVVIEWRSMDYEKSSCDCYYCFAVSLESDG